MKNWFVALLCVVGLSACQTTPPMQQLPEITFQHLKPIALNVAAIDVVDESKKQAGARHVEHRFPTSPKTAVRNWVRDRLVADGTVGSARVTILDASAIEEKLTKETGVTGFFTNDQAEKYTTHVSVKLDVFDANGNLTGFASAQAGRFTTVAEDASLHDREKAWFELVENMMADFDKTMIANMNAQLRLGR